MEPRWIVLDKKHINTNLIQAFWWYEEKDCGTSYLYIGNGGAIPLIFEDPSRDLYRQVCSATMQNPVKEEVA